MISTSFLFVFLFFYTAYAQLDIPTQKSVKLNKKQYTLRLLDPADQGRFSKAYRIEEPFHHDERTTLGILKVVKYKEGATLLEAQYMEKVKLLLHAEPSDPYTGLYYLVVEDLERRDPPFKPIYKWYIEDPEMDAHNALYTVRQLVGGGLKRIANEHNLLYHDFHMANIFVDKNLTSIIPVDWAPPVHGQEVAGVIDVGRYKQEGNQEIYQEKMNKFDRKLKTEIREEFTVEKLMKELERRGKGSSQLST